MDVDLLRPGTVPIAPETVLWFEFLLDRNLLLNHLEKHSPSPTPIDLITKFHDVVAETIRNRMEFDNNELNVSESTIDNKIKHPAKNVALKILSLKVAAFINWDLFQIRSLPFKTQVHLLQDLLYFTNNQTMVDVTKIEDEDIKTLSSPYLFALLMYHRWLLSITMHRITSNWQLRNGNNDITPVDENVFCSPDNVKKTIEFLTNSLNWSEIPDMLTFDCFNLPTETNDNIEFDWSKSDSISKEELSAQINYDLGTFFFYKEDYNLAKLHFVKCMTTYKLITSKCKFANFDESVLEMYVGACTTAVENNVDNLLEQMNLSIVNHYMGITNILQQDNIHRKIPLLHRINLELNITGALSSGTFTVAKDLLFKIKALNAVRCILDKTTVYQYSYTMTKSITTLIWAIQATWKSFSEKDRKLIKTHLMELIIKDQLTELLTFIQANAVLSQLFDKADIEYINRFNDDLEEISDTLNKTDWILYDFSKKRNPKMGLKQLEQQLISTYDHKEIRDLLVKITMNPLMTSVWNINPHWELPIPLQSVLKALPRSFIQDFGFVMLAKAKEQILSKNWNLALEMMLILDKELDSSNANLIKLSRLVSWEILLIQITQLLVEWPKNTIDIALANACEVCLQANESVLPRTEIIEQCIICLLNLGRWEFLINFDKRCPSFEITSAIALACNELVKHKGNKKLSKNLWDFVLPIFTMTQSQSKRSSSGSSVYHDTQLSNLKTNIMSVFSKLRDSTVLTVVIAMLTRLHNVLKDESSLELQVEYAILWPAVVSNANSYNTKMVCEMLSQIVNQGLHYYPTNVPWLRLMGDINFTNGHYKESLNFYLKSLLIYNDYFNIPIRNDDHVFRRMIKCCTALGCNTQAAVLCQFLEEPDYILAFRVLSEQKPCNDAVEAYYHCIWDTNILEYLIYMHNKKGEFQRRKCAIQVIGLLELNSSNNEEIQREASNLRKSTFLRALCKQYVFSN